MTYLFLAFSFLACLKGLFFTALLLVIGFLLSSPNVLSSIYGSIQRLTHNNRFNSTLIFGTGVGFLIGMSFMMSVEPAHAQFFQSTETWLTSKFNIGGGTGGGSAVSIVFNVLRAIFVIYLGISLVRVIQSARNDDDWQQLARIPLILVVTVTLGDILAKLITG
jgi:hypothetical protein